MRELCEKNKEVIRYLFFGGLAFLVSVGTFWLLNVVLGIGELIANVFSWIITVTFAFITNKLWVFEAETVGCKNFLKQMVSFFAGRIVTLVIEEGVLFVFITLMGMPSLLIKIAAQVVVIVLNYVISKLLVFRKKDE